MGFGMRINFVDVIVDNSLKSMGCNDKIIGYSFDIRLSYYRGLFLSCIETFELKVDNEIINTTDITFSVNGKIFPVSFLKECAGEFWGLTTPATIKVFKAGGIENGEHLIDLNLMLRIPYMPIPVGETLKFMPLDSCGRKILKMEEKNYE